MINNDNNQKQGEKIVKQLKRKFVKTVEENLLNHLFVQQSKKSIKKQRKMVINYLKKFMLQKLNAIIICISKMFWT